MKKISLSLIISSMLILLLAGCSSSGNSVETLKGWSFQYNEGTKDYSLFFGLCDKNDNYLSADADVAVRIENENGDIVTKADQEKVYAILKRKDTYNYWEKEEKTITKVYDPNYKKADPA